MCWLHSSSSSGLSHIICVHIRERERKLEHESIFKTHLKLLKFGRVKIESASTMRRLREEVQGNLKDMTKMITVYD